MTMNGNNAPWWKLAFHTYISFFLLASVLAMMPPASPAPVIFVGGTGLLFCLGYGIAWLCQCMVDGYRQALRERETERENREIELRKIANRAEWQHKWYLDGERKGIYGAYMPADLSRKEIES